MKRTIFLLIVILLIGAGWIAGWFYVEEKVLQVMDETTSRLAEKGRELDCVDRNTSGFPFRIGLSCETFSYEDAETGLSLKTGELKSVAQAYQPNKVVLEIADPMLLRLPGGEGFNIRWKNMRGSAMVGLSGPDRFSVAGIGLSVLPAFNAAAPSQIDDLQIHGRKEGEDAAQMVLSVYGFESELTTFPKFNASLAVTLADAYRKLLQRPDVLLLARRQGLAGTVDGLRYAPEDAGYLELRGPFEIDRLGVLSGTFELTISEGPRVFETLEQGLPQYREQIDQAGKALALLGKASGSAEITLPLSVKNGRISLGIIPVGDIKPLF